MKGDQRPFRFKQNFATGLKRVNFFSKMAVIVLNIKLIRFIIYNSHCYDCKMRSKLRLLYKVVCRIHKRSPKVVFQTSDIESIEKKSFYCTLAFYNMSLKCCDISWQFKLNYLFERRHFFCFYVFYRPPCI